MYLLMVLISAIICSVLIIRSRKNQNFMVAFFIVGPLLAIIDYYVFGSPNFDTSSYTVEAYKFLGTFLLITLIAGFIFFVFYHIQRKR